MASDTKCHLDTVPFFSMLADARSVLIAGAGGGFDMYGALPLYFRLREFSKRVWLANLSFSNLDQADGERPVGNMVEVTAHTNGPRSYFPEGHLAAWLAEQGEPAPVYAFEKTGVQPLVSAYSWLVEHHELDAVVLVDGGTDILMRGDEAGLGTPVEDITSLSAVDALDVPTKQVLCVGFGVDDFHGVCHAHFLENVAALSKEGAYLGVAALLAEMREVKRYQDAVDFVCSRMSDFPSIVANSISSAIDGEYGDYHRTSRTHGSKLWINPLMSMYWGVELGSVAKRCLYARLIRSTSSALQVSAIISAVRKEADLRSWEDIPV